MLVEPQAQPFRPRDHSSLAGRIGLVVDAVESAEANAACSSKRP
jgi:hypothetical protein